MEVSDDGMYECQISTTPTTSHSMAVSVIGKFNLETYCFGILDMILSLKC